MRLGIEINGVLRNTLKKIQQEYEKNFIDNPFIGDEEEEQDNKIVREVISDTTSLDIMKHLKFVDEQELFQFLYVEHPMEIFGHAGSVENSTMNDLNDFYLDIRDKLEIIVISDEIGKSKPASLFFLSKFGCLVESVKFYSEVTLKHMWESVDILLTANPSLLLNKPENKIVIKYRTSYNQNISSEYEITTLKELKNKILHIYGNSIE